MLWCNSCPINILIDFCDQFDASNYEALIFVKGIQRFSQNLLIVLLGRKNFCKVGIFQMKSKFKVVYASVSVVMVNEVQGVFCFFYNVDKRSIIKLTQVLNNHRHNFGNINWTIHRGSPFALWLLSFNS